MMRSRTSAWRDEVYARIYDAVRRIPHGAVATYGQIAAMAGLPRHARMVGSALRSLPERSDVPWHRVVNAAGRVSRRSLGDSDEVQPALLANEGVRFDSGGRISLREFQWDDPDDHRH